MKKTIQILGSLVLSAAILQACTKNAADVPARAGLGVTDNADSKVKILTVTAGTVNPFEILGHWADPTLGAAGFGSVPYNLANNDSTHTPVQVRFTGFFNSYIVRQTSTPLTYIGYVDKASSTLSSLTVTDVKTGFQAAWSDSIGESAAYNNFKGYYSYDATTHVPVPIANRYVIVSNNSNINSATVIYALQVDSIPAQVSGSLDKANIFGHYKLF